MDSQVVIVADDKVFAGALAAALAADGLTVGAVASDAAKIDGVLDGQATVVVATAGQQPVDGYRSVVLIDGTTEAMLDAVAAGAAGVIEADAPFDQIAAAVRQVADGHAVVPPTMLGALLRTVVERHRSEQEARKALDVLTPREREVFELAARGWDRDGIADKLFISPATARTHLQRVFAKLGIHSRAEAVALAARCGLDVEEP